jgi:hypothetical protein
MSTRRRKDAATPLSQRELDILKHIVAARPGTNSKPIFPR